MSEKQALVPVAQRSVIFYDDELTAVLVEEGGRQMIYVPVKPICDVLGVDWTAQYRRTNRDPVLSQEKTTIAITAMDGRLRELVCLPIDYISGFLFGITASRMKPALQEKLVRYQRECYKVLAQAFQEGRLTADPTFDELLQIDSPSVQAYKMIVAMAQLARQQILLENQVSAKFREYDERLEAIEISLGSSSRHITPEQAAQISQAVKAVALNFSKQTGRNEYGGVYGELYRRYQVPSYRELPTAKYDDAMSWLKEWLNKLIGEEPF